MKIWNNLALVLALATGIAGCGGGGGDGSSQQQPVASPPEAQQPVVVAEPQQPQIDLANLQVDEAFRFTNQGEVAVKVVRPQQAGQFHLSVCGEWADEAAQAVDYDTCYWKGPFSESELVLELVLPAHQQLLIAELWHIEAGSYSKTQRHSSVHSQVHFEF